MGKLSIKQKAERYDKIIEIANDERIRKALIGYFSDFRLGTFAGIEPKKIIDWLNKQGKKSTEEHEFLKEVGLSDYPEEYRLAWLKENCNMQHLQPKQERGDEPALKPKFHKGDLIVNNRNEWVCQVTEIRDDEYCIWPLYCEMKGYSRITDVDDDYHLWTIADAKDGDVLTFKNNIGGVILCKSPTDYDTGSYCRLMDYNFINKEESGWDSRLLIPAPKEGRDLLFQKIHAEGYEWDAEKKELKIALKEMQESIDDTPFEQESTERGEEDEEMFKSLEALLNDASCNSCIKGVDRILSWLKSRLKSTHPQSQWEPSNEQMKALSIAIRCGIQLGSEEEKALRSLRKQLRELKKQEK